LIERIETVLDLLRDQQQTLTFAESCTGGLLSSQVTSLPGVSDVFMGSLVAYSNRMKREILGVDPVVLSTMGAVSRPVALQMARGVKTLTDTHWAVSITGIAGPAGGTDTKPVGTVCFAIVGPGFEWSSKEHFTGSRTQVQQASAQFAIASLTQAVTGELK
jgi:PncC family amidohydrolase